MPIKITEPIFETIAKGKVEKFENFLNLNFTRKTYITKPNGSLKIPPKPHRHNFEEFFIVINGRGRLAMKDRKLTIVNLKRRRLYKVPPSTPHQAELTNGILEVYFPMFKKPAAKIINYYVDFL